MWRAWFCTTPFYRLLGSVVGNRASMMAVKNSLWGQRYPQLHGWPCDNVIEKIKISSQNMVEKCEDIFLTLCIFLLIGMVVDNKVLMMAAKKSS